MPEKELLQVLAEIVVLCDFPELPEDWEQVEEEHARNLDAIVSDCKNIAERAIAKAEYGGFNA